jgi:hypothetical protein
MPSIVSFGKIFCRYFFEPKFLRDFVGFRPVRTLLLYSDRASWLGICADSPPSRWSFWGSELTFEPPLRPREVSAEAPESSPARFRRGCVTKWHARTPREASTSLRAAQRPWWPSIPGPESGGTGTILRGASLEAPKLRTKSRRSARVRSAIAPIARITWRGTARARCQRRASAGLPSSGRRQTSSQAVREPTRTLRRSAGEPGSHARGALGRRCGNDRAP